MNNYITLLDFAVLPYVLGIVYFLAYRFRNKHYPKGHPFRKYLIPGLTIKILGAMFICLVYLYFYGYGDTFTYFRDARTVNSIFLKNPIKWVNIMLHNPDFYTPGYYNDVVRIWAYDSTSNFIVVQVTAFLGLFTFTTFLPTAILFAGLSFSGIWSLFVTFAKKFPNKIKYISWAVLFFPSIVIWGSGIFKDTICIMGLGLLTYSAFGIFVDRKTTLNKIILLAFSLLLLALTKIYILAAFIPALLFWLIMENTHKVRNRFLKYLARIFIPGAAIILLMLFNRQIETFLGSYSISNVTETSETLRNNLKIISEAQSGLSYDLGTIESTPIGLLKKAPAAINVTLFRPYLWEAKNIFSLFNAAESAILFVLTIWGVFFSPNLRNFFKNLLTNNVVQFCLIFTLVFAFAIGISTYNFGSLSRYRIPCLPFYGIFLAIIFPDPKKRPNRKAPIKQASALG